MSSNETIWAQRAVRQMLVRALLSLSKQYAAQAVKTSTGT